MYISGKTTLRHSCFRKFTHRVIVRNIIIDNGTSGNCLSGYRNRTHFSQYLYDSICLFDTDVNSQCHVAHSLEMQKCEILSFSVSNFRINSLKPYKFWYQLRIIIILRDNNWKNDKRHFKWAGYGDKVRSKGVLTQRPRHVHYISGI